MKMKGVRSSYRIRKTLVAGQTLYYTPAISAANVLLVFSHVAGTVGISPHPDVDTRPLMTAPNGGIIPWVDPAGIGALYIYSAAGGLVDIMEYLADEVAMDINVTAAVGGINVNNWPATQQVSPLAGSLWDVVDRVGRLLGVADIADKAARLLGKVGIQVAGVDVAAANPVPVTPGNGATFDVSDRAARLAGKVDLRVAGADEAVGNPVHVAPGTGATWDVSDRAARLAGKVDLRVAGADEAVGNPVHVAPGTGAIFETKPATGIAPVKTNAVGVGESVIKATPGRVFSFCADVAGMLRDGTGNDVYITPAGVVIFPARPLEFAADITWYASGAGNIYTQHE